MADVISSVGKKVGVIYNANPQSKTVEFLGYGTYMGDFIPVEAVGFSAQWHRDNSKKCGKVRLTNGKVVYSCECWLGSSAFNIRNKIKKYKKEGWKIVKVDIDSIKKNLSEAMKK